MFGRCATPELDWARASTFGVFQPQMNRMDTDEMERDEEDVAEIVIRENRHV